MKGDDHMTETTKLWLNDEEIAEIEGKMGRPGFASTWSFSTISNLLKDRESLITTIESQQQELNGFMDIINEKIPHPGKAYWDWKTGEDRKELISQIESQKEEIERQEERFKELLRSRISEDNTKIWKLEDKVKQKDIILESLQRENKTKESQIKYLSEGLEWVKELGQRRKHAAYVNIAEDAFIKSRACIQEGEKP